MEKDVLKKVALRKLPFLQCYFFANNFVQRRPCDNDSNGWLLIRVSLHESTRHPVAFFNYPDSLASLCPLDALIFVGILRTQGHLPVRFDLPLARLPVNHLLHVSDRPETLAVKLWRPESLQRRCRSNESWMMGSEGYRICNCKSISSPLHLCTPPFVYIPHSLFLVVRSVRSCYTFTRAPPQLASPLYHTRTRTN
jgi:hypothetical protein